jgi:hypothetical protein
MLAAIARMPVTHFESALSSALGGGGGSIRENQGFFCHRLTPRLGLAASLCEV